MSFLVIVEKTVVINAVYCAAGLNRDLTVLKKKKVRRDMAQLP